MHCALHDSVDLVPGQTQATRYCGDRCFLQPADGKSLECFRVPRSGLTPRDTNLPDSMLLALNPRDLSHDRCLVFARVQVAPPTLSPIVYPALLPAFWAGKSTACSCNNVNFDGLLRHVQFDFGDHPWLDDPQYCSEQVPVMHASEDTLSAFLPADFRPTPAGYSGAIPTRNPEAPLDL